MAYLEISDLKTHLYQPVIDEIIRGDNTIAQEAISAAIDMAKSYLHKYDLDKLFGTDIEAAEVESPVLKRIVKDIAVWYLITLGNPGVNLELADELHKKAILWLKDIQKGLSNPAWPYRDTSTMEKPASGDSIEFSSNPKRKNHW